MAYWYARMRITTDCTVWVAADSDEEARRKFRAGDFSIEHYDDMVDWDDPRNMEVAK